MLSEEEKQYVIGGVREDFRADGRSCEDYRGIEVECGLVSNTNGSARIKIVRTSSCSYSLFAVV